MLKKKRSQQARPHEFKSWRDLTPLNSSLGPMLHNLTGSWRFLKPVYEDKMPPCQNACPAGNDVEGWIRLLPRGEYEAAYWLLKREQPFPAILGRVCFKFCEQACNRIELDQAVNINRLERFVGDLKPSSGRHPDLPEYHDRRLAIVGSGPAGLAAAYFARLLGFKVTVFEARPEPGGMLRYGIPEYRLPRSVLSLEFEGLTKMGIELKCGLALGRDLSLEALRREFDYLFLATGAQESLKLGLRGEGDSPRIMSGLALLRQVAAGEKIALGAEVLVIGGGNTALDAARTALRLGSRVTVLYRRSAEEMPAHPDEVREAGEEGIGFRFLAAPEEFIFDETDRLVRVRCVEMDLGEPDESGRRRPVKKPGAWFELKAGTVVTAIGERADLAYLSGRLEAAAGVIPAAADLEVDLEGDGAVVLAGGDVIAQPRTVVHAVAAGKKAAIVCDCLRRGLNPAEELEKITIGPGPALSFSRYRGWTDFETGPRNIKKVVEAGALVPDYFQKAAPIVLEPEPPERRRSGFQPYLRTFAADEAFEEARRCLHCGRCIECDNCLIFCPDVSILAPGPDGFGYEIDYDYCKGCGICAAECPRGAITMIEEQAGAEEVAR
ncbi:MAG: FAD-dependent oxidoreductase [Thermodesulfobacteriota bacterium]